MYAKMPRTFLTTCKKNEMPKDDRTTSFADLPVGAVFIWTENPGYNLEYVKLNQRKFQNATGRQPRPIHKIARGESACEVFHLTTLDVE